MSNIFSGLSLHVYGPAWVDYLSSWVPPAAWTDVNLAPALLSGKWFVRLFK